MKLWLVVDGHVGLVLGSVFSALKQEEEEEEECEEEMDE